MPLSWNEIKNRAFAFSKEWENETSEHAEAKSFWDGFFNIFGISRRRTATFEAPVKKSDGKGGFIDLLWKSHLLVEHKTRGKSLETAFQQAIDYFPGLKDCDLPRYIVVSDFSRFRIYDLDTDEQHEFQLLELHKNVHLFAFIAGYQTHTVKSDDPAVDIEAAQHLGLLHDQLKKVGYEGFELEVYLVRLLFCLFADDTGIFEKQQFQDYIEIRTAEDGSDLALHISTLFHILDKPENTRLKNLDEQLASFPYIDGKLFEKVLSPASFDKKMRQTLLDCCVLDWGLISPAIFGSLFQSVMDKDLRRELGAHYTTEQNILKVIKPLFLDELIDEFENIKSDRNKLIIFHQRLTLMKFFDPACGCGNFLAITYRELRKLEIDILCHVYKKIEDINFPNINELFLIDVDQFYGIEIEEFPVQIAQVSLWMVDHQMNTLASKRFGQYFKRLPLNKAPNIICGDALIEDWVNFVKPNNQTYILSNPPYRGKQFQDERQKADMKLIFASIEGAGVLDYVAAWYMRAAQLMNKYPLVKTAYVSTNSITQGEQVSILWKELILKYGIYIHFAYRSFKWGSEVTKGKAAVHCVIIGFSKFDIDKKQIFDYDTLNSQEHLIFSRNINPYLIDAPNIFLTPQKKPIFGNVPAIVFGSMPNDGGNLLLSDDEKKIMENEEPGSTKWIRPFVGADELLNGIKRWCLWLEGITPEELRTLPRVSNRVANVKMHRIASKRDNTKKLAEYPTLFGEIRQSQEDYIVIPRVSSERRKYIPMAFLNSNVIVGDRNCCIPGGTIYHFGILSSSMHMAWVSAVCGRLKSDYNYSNSIVYNNYPWPESSEQQKAVVSEAASLVLTARAKYLHSCLADLYDPVSMPPELVKAHNILDRAVDIAYGKSNFVSLAERTAFIFSKYQYHVDQLSQNQQILIPSNDQFELKKHNINDVRLTLATMIVKTMDGTRGFGKTKFAKVFYIADMMCKQDLKTKYYREMAGPVDYRVLYDPNDNMEVLASKRGYFTTKKSGNRVHYALGENIEHVEHYAHQIFGEDLGEVKRVINKFVKLNTEQSEVVATLFACWNDLIIEKKNITDSLIINEFHNNWHLSKTRFDKNKLLRILAQMKEHLIIPKGKKCHTQYKRQDILPF